MKRITCMILSLLMILSLIGCGTQDNSSSASGGAASSDTSQVSSNEVSGAASSADNGAASSADNGAVSSADNGAASSADNGAASSADNGAVSSADNGAVSSADNGEPDGSQSSDSSTAVTAGEQSLFDAMPDQYMFSSGAGAWSTVLSLDADGSFAGQYHDSEMGSIGDGYPNGTVYICNFTGKFSEPVKVDDYTYSMQLEALEYEGEEAMEFIEDDTLYIYATPYGLTGGDEFLIYLPDKPVSELPEEFFYWSIGLVSDSDTTLGVYSIWNVNEQQAFLAYDW